jgi:ribosomal-protein-alanine N-acetyltransferase
MALMRKDSEGSRRIDGEGVFLRAPELRDYQDWAELREASRAFLMPWEPTWAQDETSRGSYRYKLRRYAEDARDDKAYALFVFREDDEALVGGATLSNIRRGVAQMASLGYWIGEKYQGKGYTTAAVRAIVRYAFEDLDLHRVEAACQPDNAPSRRVLEKAGFTQEGAARAYLKINGQWRDHLLFGIVNGL